MQRLHIEIALRPRTRRALITTVLILQAGVLMAATLTIDTWARSSAHLHGVTADRLFLFVLTISLAILTLSGAVFYMLSKRYKDSLEDTNENLECEIQRQLVSGLARRDAMIYGLARLADYRDTDTGQHLERIGRFATLLAHEIRPSHDEIDDPWIERLALASSLHDIGKVGIPDSILLKPGKLNDDERAVMERHTIIGADTLISIRDRIGSDAFIDMAIDIALAHHERWDGTGYPFGISGQEIPLSARLVALADVYDALTSPRVYKPAMSHGRAAEIIREGRGTHFDPRVVDAFDAVEDAFDLVRERKHDGLSRLSIDDEPMDLARRYLTERRRAA